MDTFVLPPPTWWLCRTGQDGSRRVRRFVGIMAWLFDSWHGARRRRERTFLHRRPSVAGNDKGVVVDDDVARRKKHPVRQKRTILNLLGGFEMRERGGPRRSFTPATPPAQQRDALTPRVGPSVRVVHSTLTRARAYRGAGIGTGFSPCFCRSTKSTGGSGCTRCMPTAARQVPARKECGCQVPMLAVPARRG